jgi:hypothetical protein
MGEHRDASNRLTYDFDSIEADSYREVTEAVAEKFGLTTASGKIGEYDVAFQDFKQGNLVIGLEWDNWSGYTVVAKRTIAEPLAKEIASYISAEFST